jgi:hypothetical protein
MSSRTVTSRWLLVCLLLTVGAAQAAGLDWESFAAASDASQDAVLLEALAAHDMDTDMAICRGVARRNGWAVAGFLDALAAEHYGADSARVELLLRVLLDSLVPAASSDAEVTSRLGPNTGAIEGLLGRIADLKDPQLKALLVRLCRFTDPGVGMPALMVVGSALARDLRVGRGEITPQEAGLALAFCAAAERTGSVDFLQPCLRIAEMSRDAVLVERARHAARVLAGP